VVVLAAQWLACREHFQGFEQPQPQQESKHTTDQRLNKALGDDVDFVDRVHVFFSSFSQSLRARDHPGFLVCLEGWRWGEKRNVYIAYSIDMKARPVLKDKKVYPDRLIVERVVYALPQATRERPHGFKYRLYCGYLDRCLVRSGKGDHIHYGDEEHPYRFTSLERLMTDFEEDIRRLRRCNMANKVFIGVESFDEMARRARETARRIDKGERVPEADYYLNFSSAAHLFSELTPARLALLELLKLEGPLSIYGLAKRLDRNYSNVHRDVQKLLEHELVAKDAEGRLYVPWEEIQIHLSLCSAA